MKVLSSFRHPSAGEIRVIQKDDNTREIRHVKDDNDGLQFNNRVSLTDLEEIQDYLTNTFKSIDFARRMVGPQYE